MSYLHKIHMCYPKSVSCIEFLMDFSIYDDILDTIQITDKTLLHFKLSKSGQILHVDIRMVFPGPVTYGQIFKNFNIVSYVDRSLLMKKLSGPKLCTIYGIYYLVTNQSPANHVRLPVGHMSPPVTCSLHLPLLESCSIRL